MVYLLNGYDDECYVACYYASHRALASMSLLDQYAGNIIIHNFTLPPHPPPITVYQFLQAPPPPPPVLDMYEMLPFSLLYYNHRPSINIIILQSLYRRRTIRLPNIENCQFSLINIVCIIELNVLLL